MFICGLVIFRPFNLFSESYVPNQVLWIDEWLQNPVCQPPCLDNIMPGVTPGDEVPEKLSEHSGVARVEHLIERYDGYDINWTVSECESIFGSVIVDMDTQIVNRIFISNYLCGAQISLGDFIDAFGEPDYVYPYTQSTLFHSKCMADLYYVDKGMRVQIFSIESMYRKRINITHGSLIDSMALFPSQTDIEQTLKSQSSHNLYRSDINKIVPWEGYGKYRCVP